LRKCKPKNCRVCKNTFQPMNSLQYACSPKCALTATREKEALRVARELKRSEKAAKRALKARREALKSKSDHFRETQAVFNRFIRLRDQGMPCISCQRHHTGQYHAGHYLTTAAFPEKRYLEDNCHKQCSACNNHLSGNISAYRIHLKEKIGADRLACLEGPHPPKKYTIDDLKKIKSDYKKKIKELGSV